MRAPGRHFCAGGRRPNIAWWLLAGVLPFVATANPVPCDETRSLTDVLERYVTARGGRDAIEQQRTLRIVSTHHEADPTPIRD